MKNKAFNSGVSNPGSGQLTNPVYGTERKVNYALKWFLNMPIFIDGN